jgi:hypothetical protein
MRTIMKASCKTVNCKFYKQLLNVDVGKACCDGCLNDLKLEDTDEMVRRHRAVLQDRELALKEGRL